MKKIKRIALSSLLPCFFSLASCNTTYEESHAYKRDVTVSFQVTADYGIIEEGKVTKLLMGEPLQFNPSDYDLDNLLIGDIVTIKCHGDWSGFSSSNIESITVDHAEIVEFIMSQVPGGGKSLKRNGSTYKNLKTRYLINENDAFGDIDSLAIGDKAYGMKRKDEIVAFYDYHAFVIEGEKIICCDIAER